MPCTRAADTKCWILSLASHVSPEKADGTSVMTNHSPRIRNLLGVPRSLPASTQRRAPREQRGITRTATQPKREKRVRSRSIAELLLGDTAEERGDRCRFRVQIGSSRTHHGRRSASPPHRVEIERRKPWLRPCIPVTHERCERLRCRQVTAHSIVCLAELATDLPIRRRHR